MCVVTAMCSCGENLFSFSYLCTQIEMKNCATGFFSSLRVSSSRQWIVISLPLSNVSVARAYSISHRPCKCTNTPRIRIQKSLRFRLTFPSSCASVSSLDTLHCNLILSRIRANKFHGKNSGVKICHDKTVAYVKSCKQLKYLAAKAHGHVPQATKPKFVNCGGEGSCRILP